MNRAICASLLLVCVTGAGACHSRGDARSARLEPAEQLNAEHGTLGVFTFPYYTSLIALEGGGAVVSWMRQERERDFRPIVARRAADARSPFGAEQYLSPESQRDTISVVPQLIAGPAPGELYAMWQARRQKSGDKYVMFRRSTDGGTTWEADHRVNSQPTSFIPSVATDADGAIYAAWTDERRRGFQIFFNRSLDHGATWLPDDLLIEGSDARSGTAISVDVATDGDGTVLVVWEENAAGGRRIRAATSRDRGATWSEPVRIDDGASPLSPSAPSLVFVGDRAVVVWTAAVSGERVMGQVWSDTSADGGQTWEKDVLVSSTEGGVPPRAHIVSAGGKARVVFHAGALKGPWQIYYAETADDGTWGATPSRPVPVTDSTGRLLNPRLAVDRDGAMYVICEDFQRRVLLSRSVDGGHTWTALDEPVFALPDTTSDMVHYPQIAVADGVAYATWEVWGSSKDTVKTLADAQKASSADFYVRRIVFPRS